MSNNKTNANQVRKEKDLILIVDDQPNNLKVIASILQEEYTLGFANNGFNALKMLERGKPDLILLDIMMPDLDGFEVCRRIKEQKNLKDIPVIFLSAKNNIDDIIKGFQSGAVDYITKPFNSLEVKVRVKNHLSLHHETQDRIRAEERLRESEQLLNSVLQSQKEMIFRFGLDTKITFVNKSFANFFDNKKEELIGNLWVNLFPVMKKDELLGLIANLHDHPKETITFQQKVFSGSGIKKWQEWKGYAIQDNKGNVIQYQFIGYDVTDRIERLELEKEIQIARNTLKFKQNFLAAMSHEIRTPLTGIIGIAELLGYTKLNSTQQDHLQTLQLSADNLREILDQVLDYSRIESGNVQLNMRPITFEKLMLQAERFFMGICRKPIEFTFTVEEHMPKTLTFDHKRITQVLNNLITNSVKFTNKGRISVLVSKQLTNAENNNDIQVRIIVTDTGIGIREEKQKTIFSPFSQVHTIESENYTGIGLGLSICREIVEMHGGEIGVNSQPGKGTTIWFTYKAQIIDENTTDTAQKDLNAKKADPTDRKTRNLKILFAEDKVTTQKVVKLMLNSMGHEVVLTNNGKEALEANDPETFDLILMDIQMPLMDGITATQKLKEKYDTLPPIVGLSANAFEGDREKYMALGMDEYLTKPVKKEDFEKLIGNLIV